MRGRGIYVCPLSRCLHRALKNPRLRVDPALSFDELRRLARTTLLRRLTRVLRGAMRSGAALGGYDAIHRALGSDLKPLAVFANEGSPRQRTVRLAKRAERFDVEWIWMPLATGTPSAAPLPDLRLAIRDVRVVDELRSSIEAIVALASEKV